jgi:hypothetical protein
MWQPETTQTAGAEYTEYSALSTAHRRSSKIRALYQRLIQLIG